MTYLPSRIIDAVQSVNATGAVSNWGTQYRVTTGASDLTLTLPTAVGNLLRPIEIIKIDSGAGKIIVQGNSGQLIAGVATLAIQGQWNSAVVRSNGTDIDVVEEPASAATSGAAVPEWLTGTTYVAFADLVVDPATSTLFRCIVSHTAGTTPPSQDATNWAGLDVNDLGKVSIASLVGDVGPNLLMTAGRTVSRTKYSRLLNAIAPQFAGNSITAGSTTLGIAPGKSGNVGVGFTVEGAGITPGTTVASLAGEGQKVGSNLATGNVINWKVGVLAVGYSITANKEVSGGGIGAAATTLAAGSTTDTPVAANTYFATTGSTLIAGASNTTLTPTPAIGDYISHAAFPANSRIAKFQNQTSLPATSRYVAGQPFVYLAPSIDALGTIDLGATTGPTIIGRRFQDISGNSFGVNSIIQSIPKRNYTSVSTGKWDYVLNTGFFSPWDVNALDTAETTVNRKIAGVGAGPTNAAPATITALQAAGSALGSFHAGTPSLFWNTSFVAPAITSNVKVGSLTAGLPTDTYITAHTASVALNLGTLTGVGKVYWPTGATANGTLGQRVSITAGAGVSNAKITAAPTAESTLTNVTSAVGSANLYPQPGAITSALTVGQMISMAQIPANTRINAIAPDGTEASAYWASGVATFSVQPGTSGAYVVGQRVTGTGRAVGSANSITALTQAEVVKSCVGLAGNTRLFFDAGVSTTGIITDRIIDATRFAANTRTSGSPTAGTASAQANVGMLSGGNNAFFPGGVTTLPAAAVAGGGVKFAGAEPGFTFASITSAAAVANLSASINTGTNLAYVGPTILSVAVGAFPNIPTGRGIAIAGSGLTNATVTGVASAAASGTGNFNGQGTGFGGGTGGVITVSGWSGRALTAADVNTYITHNASGIRVARITAVLSATSFQFFSTSNTSYNGANATAVIGPRYSVSANATLTVNQSVLDVGAVPAINGSLAPFLTLSTAATSNATASMDVLSFIPLVNAAGAATTPSPNADFGPSNITFGAVYTLNGNSTAALNYGTASVGGVITASANATAATTTGSLVCGRWANIDQNATGTQTPGAATLGAVSILSAVPTATSDPAVPSALVSVGYGAVVSTNNSAVATSRATITNVTLGAIIQATANATTTVENAAVNLGPAIDIDASATATSSPAWTLGGHTALDVPNASAAVDATYSFGTGVTLSANATATNPNASLRFFPYGQGDGSTTFGIGQATNAVNGRTMSIYAGA